LSGTLLITACGGSEEQSAASSQKASVEVAELSSSQVTSTNMLSGTLKSEIRSEIGTKVIGEVESTPYEIGDRVRKGAVILHIKDDDLMAKKAQVEAGLEEVKAKMTLVEKDYNRYKSLHENGSATEREWDEVQTNYTATKARLASTESQLTEIEDLLSYTRIKAPYNGVIAALYVDEGDIASPGRPLVALEKDASFEVEVTVPESNIQNVTMNDTLGVNIPSAGLEGIKAVVSELSSSGDPMSRQFTMKLKLIDESAYSGLRSGMYAEVGISKNAGRTLFIPTSAVVERGQLQGVYVISANQQAVLRWITTGTEKNDMIEVLSGISEGEQFVKNSAQVDFDGQSVSLTN
jgi:RND family efflux transporter MFP subunit